MSDTIRNFDGLLYVQEDWSNDWSNPIRRKLAWPIGILTVDYPELVDQPCKYLYSGIYESRNGIKFRLEYGGSTKSSTKYSMTEPIPKPKGAKEYYNGDWR